MRKNAHSMTNNDIRMRVAVLVIDVAFPVAVTPFGTPRKRS
jgi:hypothetical protein